MVINEDYFSTTDEVREVVEFLDTHKIGNGVQHEDGVEVLTDYSPFYVLPSVGEKLYWVVTLNNKQKLCVAAVHRTITRYPADFAARVLKAMVRPKSERKSEKT